MRKLLLCLIILIALITESEGASIKDKDYADIQDKMFTMMFDLHSEKMGYDRTEQICGFGTTMKERGYAIYKGVKYHPDELGFIIINTNK